MYKSYISKRNNITHINLFIYLLELCKFMVTFWRKREKNLNLICCSCWQKHNRNSSNVFGQTYYIHFVLFSLEPSEIYEFQEFFRPLEYSIITLCLSIECRRGDAILSSNEQTNSIAIGRRCNNMTDQNFSLSQ